MEASNPTALADQVENRRTMYALLALLYRTEVTDDLLAALQEEGALGGAEGAMGEALAQMEAYLASPEASVLDLARDYAKVFCGAASTHKTAAYPFESVYTSDNGMLMQEARDGALSWYRRFGLGKSDAWHDCEDHVALELEFSAYLLEHLGRALATGDYAEAARLAAAQRDFVAEHLVNWIPEFSRHVRLRSRTDFYQGLGRLVGVFVSEDYEQALAVADELGAPPRVVLDDLARAS